MKKLICKYCGGPILPFQKKTVREGMHEGCYELKKEGEENKNETTRN